MAPRHRKAADYARRAPAREPYDRVLIVCEGEKTEPQYFNGLRLAERLSSANIRVTPADGSDPGKDNAGTGNHNPSTRVHGLVSYLLHLREQV